MRILNEFSISFVIFFRYGTLKGVLFSSIRSLLIERFNFSRLQIQITHFWIKPTQSTTNKFFKTLFTSSYQFICFSHQNKKLLCCRVGCGWNLYNSDIFCMWQLHEYPVTEVGTRTITLLDIIHHNSNTR